MKKLLAVLMAVIVAECFGQGLLSRVSRGGLRRPGQQSREKLFFEKHPTGTNEFNRTFEQQLKYEENCDLKEFLGFGLGEKHDGRTDVKLAKPFRSMVDVNLGLTVKGRIARVSVGRKTVDISDASLSNEVDKIVSLLSRHYKVSFSENRPRWYGGTKEDKWFFNEHIALRVSKRYDAQCGTGEIWLMAEKKSLFKDDVDAVAMEKAREIEKKCKKYDIPADEGVSLLSSSVPLVQTIENTNTREEERRAQAEQEKAQREAELAEKRQQLLAIQEELLRARLVKANSGAVSGLVKELEGCKELAQRSKMRYEQLLGMSEESKKLSPAAKKLYETDLASAKDRMESDSRRVDDIQAMLTPEKIEAEKHKQEETAKAKA